MDRTKPGYFNIQFQFNVQGFSRQESCIPYSLKNYVKITCFEVPRIRSGDEYIKKQRNIENTLVFGTVGDQKRQEQRCMCKGHKKEIEKIKFYPGAN